MKQVDLEAQYSQVSSKEGLTKARGGGGGGGGVEGKENRGKKANEGAEDRSDSF